MKNLHFYIQCSMVLLAICVAVQIPLDRSVIFYLVLIEFALGCYQLGLSILLNVKLTRKTVLLKTHFYLSFIYVIALIVLGIKSPEWMDDLWKAALFIVPWIFALLFLVAMDELEYKRKYRL